MQVITYFHVIGFRPCIVAARGLHSFLFTKFYFMKRKILFGLVLLFSLCVKSGFAQGTYQDGYNRGYAMGRANTVTSVQNFTTQYLRAEEGDQFEYAQGLEDGFNAGLLVGPIISPKVQVTSSAGGGTFDEGGYSTWLYDLVNDGFEGTGVLVVHIE